MASVLILCVLVFSVGVLSVSKEPKLESQLSVGKAKGAPESNVPPPPVSDKGAKKTQPINNRQKSTKGSKTIGETGHKSSIAGDQQTTTARKTKVTSTRKQTTLPKGGPAATTLDKPKINRTRKQTTPAKITTTISRSGTSTSPPEIVVTKHEKTTNTSIDGRISSTVLYTTTESAKFSNTTLFVDVGTTSTLSLKTRPVVDVAAAEAEVKDEGTFDRAYETLKKIHPGVAVIASIFEEPEEIKNRGESSYKATGMQRFIPSTLRGSTLWLCGNPDRFFVFQNKAACDISCNRKCKTDKLPCFYCLSPKVQKAKMGAEDVGGGASYKISSPCVISLLALAVVRY